MTEELKPNQVRVYGASDDLVEIDGFARDEFGAYDAGKMRLAISDGTLLSIEYDDEGIWRIAVLATGNGSTVHIDPAADGDEDDYSDIATVTAVLPLRWCVLSKGEDYAMQPKGASK